VRAVVAVRRLARNAVLRDELAVVCELQDVRVASAVSADPDVVLVVERDAVVGVRPNVAFAGPAPPLHEVALGVELQDRRRCTTALADGRRRVRADLRALIERRVAAVDDEDVIPRVHTHADRGAEDPVVRQRLGPHGVYFEPGRLHALQSDLGDERPLADAEGGEGRDEGASYRNGTPTDHRLLLVLDTGW
jgi:hypothetical protein